MNLESLDIPRLIEELASRDSETEWIEFKTSNAGPIMIGERVSAPANSACRLGIPTAYMVWGVHDKTHEIVGSDFRYRLEKYGNEELENWLHHELSHNAEFAFAEGEVNNKRVTVLAVDAASYHPVEFKRISYVRVGSITKKLRDYPAIEREVWDRITKSDFEGRAARQGMNLSEALDLLDYSSYFTLLGTPIPSSHGEVAHYLQEDGILRRQDDGRFAITCLGALLLAKNLDDFSAVERKALRIVQYDGVNRSLMLRNREYKGGYASIFESAVEMIMALTPSVEEIDGALRKKRTAYPEPAVREILANALIHQDFSLSGGGPVVEVFDGRVEFTNPGTSLVDPMRLVDNPPRSRNEALAGLMRRFHICEELGTGWDKIILACERHHLPAPIVEQYDAAGGSMRVSLLAYSPYASMAQMERIMTCYWHACICRAEGTTMRNGTLRERFGEDAPSPSAISKLIAATMDAGLIKPLDESSSPRLRRYVPYWA